MLVEHVGATAAAALRLWEVDQGVIVDVPPVLWRPAAGYTGAIVRRIIVSDDSTGVRRDVLLKVCPPGRAEGAGHVRAWRDSEGEPDVRARLVEPYPSGWPTADGSILLMQRPAGGVMMLSELPTDGIATVTRAVVRWLTTVWNRGERSRRTQAPLSGLLSDQLAETLLRHGSITRWENLTSLRGREQPWLRLDPDGPPLPNPLFLTTAAAPVHRFGVRIGRAHRDLHLDNIMVAPSLDDFQLIDLATYRTDTPLTVDPAVLLLSAALQALPDAPAGRAATRDAFLDPASPGLAGYRECVEAIGERWDMAWHTAWLTAIIGAALRCTTYDGLAASTRWWCLELASHAADRIRTEAGVPLGPADDAPLVLNPFRDGVSGAPQPPPSPVAPLLVRAARARAAGATDVAVRLLREALRRAVTEAFNDDPPAVTVDRLQDLAHDATRIFGADHRMVLEIDLRRADVMNTVRGRRGEARRLMVDMLHRAEHRYGTEHQVTIRIGAILDSPKFE
ncbi:hypothetical protein [Dactylosporangium sp. NPDC005555]|uniref:hypothetical protein n=1 Tax=Dactylosporangium sp. NPDC005555 TaxID=3154889 RepID=UPI0033B0F319